MNKWEYRHFEYNHDEGYPQQALDELGAQGWEAFEVTKVVVEKAGGTDEIWVTYHFKRVVVEGGEC